MTPWQIAKATSDAYSAGRYRSWAALASMLQKRGYTDAEVNGILRSKWTRWAADASKNPNGKATVGDLERFLDEPRNGCTNKAVEELAEPLEATK